MENFRRIVAVHSLTSSRASEYDQKVAPALKQIATTRGVEFVEIPLNKVPYFEAVQMVRETLKDDDVLFGAGGDGVNQVTLQGLFESKKQVVAGFLPLGNANDFASALNGSIKNPTKILTSKTLDFHPLELTINRRIKFYVAAYATFGITTVAVDWLNSEPARDTRQRRPRRSPVASLRPSALGQLSRNINALSLPVWRRDGLTYRDDSIGFFLTPAAKGLLHPPGVGNFLARDDFFFHFDKVRGRSSNNSWFGKSLVAGRWATFGLPGVVSDYEELEFLPASDLSIHVGGDTVSLSDVRTVTAERASDAVKIFVPRQ
ncbi:hypothetical protein FWD20_00135 [Candidatus Saccharibacteria bacterium]|nr:hypothetical protein [Candidatus Saccharibacteria bacterium]